MAARKPWGEGPAAVLKSRRADLATKLADILAKRLDHDRISTTGELFPRGNFKKATQKNLFDFCFAFPGRTFTSTLCKLVVKKLVAVLGRDTIPWNPKLSYAKFVAKQALRFQKLVQRAKRVKVGVAKTETRFRSCFFSLKQSLIATVSNSAGSNPFPLKELKPKDCD